MDQYKLRVRRRRDSGLPCTVLKLRAQRRQSNNRRLLPNKFYEALTEEPEVDEMNDPTVKPTSLQGTSSVPVHRKSVSHLSSPAFPENPGHKATSPATPADKRSGCQMSPTGNPAIRVTPIPQAFKRGVMPGREESLAVTPESITSSSMELDTTFSSDDEDENDEEEEEENDYSSDSSASSSLPSPEIFRKENDVENIDSLHLHIKNSTLLDVSHAESIHTYHHPNLSNIIDASTILAENNHETRAPEPEAKIQTDSVKSDEPFKKKTPPKITSRRPILFKKKVWFKSPLIAETFKVRHIQASRLTIHNTSEPFQSSNPPKQVKSDAETSRTGEISCKEETLCLRVMQKRPLKSNLKKAKFFDFVNENERDAFFQKMRESCVKLKSATLFPLTVAKHAQSSAL